MELELSTKDISDSSFFVRKLDIKHEQIESDVKIASSQSNFDL